MRNWGMYSISLLRLDPASLSSKKINSLADQESVTSPGPSHSNLTPSGEKPDFRPDLGAAHRRQFCDPGLFSLIRFVVV